MINKYNYDKQFGLYLKPNTKAVIDEILKYVNDKGIAFPSLKTISHGINIHARTVQRHIRVIKNITIGDGLPFVIVYRKREIGGTFSHNVYYFPWLDRDKWKEYIKEHQLSVINALIKEFEEELEKQIENQTTNQSSNFKEDRISTSYLKKMSQKLSETLNIGIDEVFRILVSVGERILMGDIIFNLDRYLFKAFKVSKKQEQATNIIQKMYQALLGAGQDWYSVDWSSFANTLSQY